MSTRRLKRSRMTVSGSATQRASARKRRFISKGERGHGPPYEPGGSSVIFVSSRWRGVVREQLREALRDQLVAEPFGLAETFPAVAPVGLEAAGALEAPDIAEHSREPRDKCIDRPGPAQGLALVRCVGAFRDGHGADYTAASDLADSVPLFPSNFRGKLLRALAFVREFPSNSDNGYPSNSCISLLRRRPPPARARKTRDPPPTRFARGRTSPCGSKSRPAEGGKVARETRLFQRRESGWSLRKADPRFLPIPLLGV